MQKHGPEDKPGGHDFYQKSWQGANRGTPMENMRQVRWRTREKTQLQGLNAAHCQRLVLRLNHALPLLGDKTNERCTLSKVAFGVVIHLTM